MGEGAKLYSDINEAVLRNIGSCKVVLDVGCGTGFLGEKMRQKGNIVFGIERSKAEAAMARKRLDNVFVADIEKAMPGLGKRFGVIVFADVLEHLDNPEEALRKAKGWLAKNGEIIVSVPNKNNWEVRIKKMFGIAKPTDYGILDRTHKHFFCLQSIKRIVENNGFSVERIDVTPNFARQLAPVARVFSKKKNNRAEQAASVIESRAYKAYRTLVLPVETLVARAWKDCFAFQLVVIAKKK